MTLCSFEDAAVAHLAPLAYTRAAFDLRVGARTLLESQIAAFPEATGLTLHTRRSVAGATAIEHPHARVRGAGGGPTLYVNARWRAGAGAALEAVRAGYGAGEARAFVQDSDLIALWDPAGAASMEGDAFEIPAGVPIEPVEGAPLVARLWHLVDAVEERVGADVGAMSRAGGITGGDIRDGARVVGASDVHVAPGAIVRAGAIVTAEDGPVRIESGAVVEEHALVRGPCWIGPGAVVRAGARVDGSAIGPQAKVAGEVHASVVVGLSNKAHEGYLGNSYLGRWCNLGAGTDASNLRNDYGEITLWDPVAQDYMPTGRRFLGLIMADHAKCAIGTRFNSGTLVGVACNWFGAGFPPRRLPSFSWGGDGGLEPYRLEKALQVAQAAMERRGRTLQEAERSMLAEVFDATAGARAAVFGREDRPQNLR